MPSRPRAPSPHSAAAEASTREWAARTGIARGATLGALARIGVGAFAGNTYAGAPADIVALGADLITWLYLFDDRHGESADSSMFAAVDALLADPATLRPTDPFLDALHDLLARAAPRAPAGWRGRFAASLRAYFDGCLRERPYRRTGRVPTVDAYRELRRLSVGAYPVFDLIELVPGRALDDAIAGSPAMRAAREVAAGLTAWVNDLYSFAKERADDDPLNLVTVLRAAHDLTVEGALAAAVELYAADLRRLRELVADLPHAHAYLPDLVAWVHGNHAWTRTSGRYLPPPSA